MTTLEYALRYLGAGISVIPVRRDGTKAPALPSWRDYQDYLPLEDDACHWWRGPCPPGIAAVCGTLSGGLELLDFDWGELLDPWQDLVECEFPGLVSRLTLVRTPRRPAGYHAWLRCPDWPTPGNQKLALDPGAPGKGRTLIETRGEGGYALLPGCPVECHETGRPYEHFAGPPLWELAPIGPAERACLIRCARLFTREASEEEVPPPFRPAVAGRQQGALLPGEDFDRRGPDWSDILTPHGWALAGSHGAERRWRRPGKGRGWSATTGHCRAKDGADLLRVFSSNAQPFEDGRAYGKFRALCLLEHGGGWGDCAAALAAAGYGAKRGRQAGQRAFKTPAPCDVEYVLGALAAADPAVLRRIITRAMGPGAKEQ